MDAWATDTGGLGRTVTPSGSVASNATAYFGTSSAFYDTAGGTLLLSSPNTLSGDFSVDMWVRPSLIPTGGTTYPAALADWDTRAALFSTSTFNGTDGYALIFGQTTLMFASSDVIRVSGTHGMVADQWYHIAVCRSGSILSIFVNGTRIGTATYATSMSTGGRFDVGSEEGRVGYYKGHLDAFRIRVGSSVFDAAQATLTVPTSAPVNPNTVYSGGPAGSFGNPWNRLSSVTGVVANADKVWMRRVRRVVSVAEYGIDPNCNLVPLIGWPLPTDDDYASRPEVAKTLWDADTETHATLEYTHEDPAYTTHNAIIYLNNVRTYTFKRLKITKLFHSSMSNVVSGYRKCIFYHNAGALYLQYCHFENIASLTNPPAANANPLFAPLFIAALYQSDTDTAWTTVGASDCVLKTNLPGTAAYQCPLAFSNSHLTTSYPYAPGFTRCQFIAAGGSKGFTGSWIGLNNPTYGGSLSTAFVDCTMQSSYCGVANYHPFAVTSDRDYARTSFIRCKWIIEDGPVSGNMGGIETQMSHYEDCEADGVGWINLTLRGSGNWRRITQRRPRTDGAFIYVYGRDVMYVCDNVTFVGGNQCDVHFPESASNTLLMRNVRTGTGGYRLTERNRLILADIDGMLGTWVSRTFSGEVRAHRATRTGGANFSAQVLPYSASSDRAPNALANMLRESGRLSLSRETDPALTVALAAGSRTITVYGAYYGFTTPPNLNSLWMDAAYATASGRIFASTRTTALTALTSDASAWTGCDESPVTAFRLDLTFTMSDATVADIRIHTIAFDTPSAKLYLDPRPVIG
jgi:hypothetical protein